MSLNLGSLAPDFVQSSTAGLIELHRWADKSWVLLFSHPKDFTPVCTTELGYVAKLKGELEARNAKVLALSVDDLASHTAWVKDIEETQGVRVTFPILADVDRKVSTLYGMIHPQASDTLTVRSVFIIDPDRKIRATLTYPASSGRNFDEILRLLDSLQLTDSHQVATPANWKHGDEVVIVPSLTDVRVLHEKFPRGYRAVKPYLRLTPDPSVKAPEAPNPSRIREDVAGG